MSAAPARALAPRPAPRQSALFEADPYRVPRPRGGSARLPARPLGAPRSPVPVQRSSAPRATVSAMTTPEYSRSLVPFVAMCVAIVLGSLIAVLVLNTTMTQRAYETRDLRRELAGLDNQRSELLATLQADGSPQALAQAALALGMFPAPRVGFVTIESGVVVAPGATG